MIGRRHILAGIVAQARRAGPDRPRRASRAYSSRAHSGLSRSSCMRNDTSLQRRCRSMREPRIDLPAVGAHSHVGARQRLADVARAACASPWRARMSRASRDARRRHLQDRARALRQSRRRSDPPTAPKIDVEPAMRGERHLQQRDEHAAVRAVVVGEQQAAILQLAQRGEQARQQLRTVEIRRLAAALADAPAPSTSRPGDSCPRPSR